MRDHSHTRQATALTSLAAVLGSSSTTAAPRDAALTHDATETADAGLCGPNTRTTSGNSLAGGTLETLAVSRLAPATRAASASAEPVSRHSPMMMRASLMLRV